MARKKTPSPLSPPSELVLPEMIGFRLDEDNARLLIERAAEQKVSPGELARACVIEIMHQAEALAELDRALMRLKDGLDQSAARNALGVEALLVSAGKVEGEEALKWVDANLR